MTAPRRTASIEFAPVPARVPPWGAATVVVVVDVLPPPEIVVVVVGFPSVVTVTEVVVVVLEPDVVDVVGTEVVVDPGTVVGTELVVDVVPYGAVVVVFGHVVVGVDGGAVVHGTVVGGGVPQPWANVVWPAGQFLPP
jgi:hypothetical protein